MAAQPSRVRSIDGIRPRQSTAKAPSGMKKFAAFFTKRKQYVLATVVAAAIGGVVFGAIMVAHKSAVNTANLNDVKTVKAKVEAHYLLPTDEEPALATVTDKNKLNTPFLKKAENGDKILIYQQNQVAIIYRPSIDRVVSVGPVTIDAPPQATQSQPGN